VTGGQRRLKREPPGFPFANWTALNWMFCSFLKMIIKKPADVKRKTGRGAIGDGQEAWGAGFRGSEALIIFSVWPIALCLTP
jgi:hypothetical protein